MDEHDRRKIRLRSRRHKPVVDFVATHFCNRSDWRVEPLDPRGLDAGQAGKRKQCREQEPKDCQGKIQMRLPVNSSSRMPTCCCTSRSCG